MENKSNNFAVASLVTGIVSIMLCWVPPAGLICGILAIIFSIKAKRNIGLYPELQTSRGMATGGLITAIIGLVFSVLYSIVWLFIYAVSESFSSGHPFWG